MAWRRLISRCEGLTVTGLSLFTFWIASNVHLARSSEASVHQVAAQAWQAWTASSEMIMAFGLASVDRIASSKLIMLFRFREPYGNIQLATLMKAETLSQ